jgi:hypothetical protein
MPFGSLIVGVGASFDVVADIRPPRDTVLDGESLMPGATKSHFAQASAAGCLPVQCRGTLPNPTEPIGPLNAQYEKGLHS